METTARFVSEANVARFIDQLERSNDAETQHVLKELLIEEENRFGRHAALLDAIERHIERAAVRIAEQKQRIDRLKADGRDTEQSELLLQNMRSVERFLISTRNSWEETLRQVAP